MKISDKAVADATGKTWEEWFGLLDKKGGREMTHKEIVSILHDEYNLSNPWWCQMLTSTYERARGKKTVGQTESAGFEIGIQRTFPVSESELWKLITESPGRDIWLGTVPDLKLSKGFTYQTAEGTRGEIRSFKNESKLRLTWQQPNRQAATTLQLSVQERGEKAVIRIHQEKLSNENEREQMRQHWSEVLDKIEQMLNAPRKKT
ncbi:MAG: DUF4287 domain-containing protein [Aliifodinibius sp.]|nr:DUF4287 domain-containing protein [Fodinibius sp.]